MASGPPRPRGLSGRGTLRPESAVLQYPSNYGNYILLERLGVGGMSEVDLARQRMGDRDFVRFVVIKRIKTDRSADAAFIRMFKDEARITSELHHESIGQVYDFGRQGDEYYLALEYVPGIDVRGIINALRDRGQRVPIRVALRILCDVLEALEYAHRKRDAFGKPMNIVHRDVNPRNIMVSIHGETKLIDFGVAKAAGRLERTKTDHVKGKFSYMAPEQITGDAIDARVDIFAVGLTLHEFLAGYGPFYGLNQVQIVHRLLHGQMPEMPAVRDLPDDSELRRVHDRALAPDPAKRYASAREFRRDLENIADSVGGLPTREQLARFLNKVDPSIGERLQEKMRAYAGDLDLTTEAGVPRPVAIMPEEVMGTMDSAVSVVRQPMVQSENTGSQFTRTQTVTIGVMSAISGVAVVAVVSAVVTVLVLLIALTWLRPIGPIAPATQPLPVDAVPAPVPDPSPTPAPAPVPISEPEPAAPAPAPAPSPSPSPRTRPRPRPRPDPRPEPAAPVAAPEPAPAPVPVAAPAPEPDPVPAAPSVDPSLYGTLAIASDPKGATVRIDGVVKGRTPLQTRVPPGSYSIDVEGYAPRTVRVSSKQLTPVKFE